MPRIKLTARTVETAKAPPTGRIELWDRTLPGFGLRITDKGRKSWVAMYRMHGRLCRRTLGHYPALPLAEARGKARDVMGQAEKGIDPRAESQAAKSRQAMTVKDACEFYIERYAKRNKSSWEQDDQALKRDVIPVWGNRPLVSVTDDDVNDLLWKITDRGAPVVANRILTLLKKTFAFLVEEKRMVSNPAAGVSRKTDEQERDRVLEDFELKRIWEALRATAYPFGRWYTVRLLTGQRRQETARMKWSQLEPLPITHG
ncbi:MAG: integrase family protein, partial [Alphaproteobacteria bacterium]